LVETAKYVIPAVHKCDCSRWKKTNRPREKSF